MRAPTVLHVDLDAFYVSMELLRRPELRGRPVIVAGIGPRGVVTTASYEARKFGVRSAMPTTRALRLCPHGDYIPPDFSWYAPASKAFHEILRSYTPACEPAGADEAYLDTAGSERLFGDGETIARDIRRRVREEIGIAASVGVSTNKLVSKVASDAAKPDGLLVVPDGGEAAFFAPRPLRELPMIGPKTQAALERLGLRTIGDLAAYPIDLLQDRFGQHGYELHQRALGLFDAPVLGGRGAAKSVSREVTFGEDEASREALRALIRSHAERIAADLTRQGRAARTVTLKLRFPPFETLTRALTGDRQVEFADDIFAAATALFEKAWSENGERPVRLLGVGVTNLEDRARQLRLEELADSGEPGQLDEAVARLRDKFGDAAIRRAAELGHRPPRHPAADSFPPFA